MLVEAGLGGLSQPTTGYPAVSSESPWPYDVDVSAFMLIVVAAGFKKIPKKFLHIRILVLA